MNNKVKKVQYLILMSLLFFITIMQSRAGPSDNGMKHNHALEQHAAHNNHPMSMQTSGNESADKHQPADEMGGDDPHAHHRHMMMKKSYTRSEQEYKLPDLALVAMDGERTTLLQEIESDQPVMVNFIFTTCTTICPVLSATFSSVQQQLGEDRDRVRMISISIDPEYDTPERLRVYAERFDAGPQWQFLTGELQQVIATQKAFDAYRGSKMNHEPTTFLRASSAAPWVRLDGIASAADIVREYQQLAAR